VSAQRERGSVKDRRAVRRGLDRQRTEAVRLRRRRMRWIWSGAAGVLLVALIAALIVANHADATPSIDGIQCETSEGAVTHIHQHLAMYDRGKQVALPAGIGIDQAKGCLFWLHVHATDGVIHVESPKQATYTLGQFFDIWGQPLGRAQFATVQAGAGRWVRAYVNGRLLSGDPRAIPLTSHARIVLEAGPPWVAPPSFTFPAGD
jgi:hypothetical protein